MKRIVLVFSCLSLINMALMSQNAASVIREMKWGLDYNISLVLSNDSTYVLNVGDLYQTDQSIDDVKITFYPVNFKEGYVQLLKDKNASDEVETDEDVYKNLWRALNSVLSGGYAHFINCVLYSIETEQLDLMSAEMTRPESDWKPSPMTDTYKRTKKWKYYVPVDQKLAIKEYKAKQKSGQLADLDGIPESYKEVFLNTKQKDYDAMKTSGNKEKMAQIDLVKLLLGSNYLGEDQIKYIQKQVLKAALEYSIYDLPSVIIFNNFNAAVAMSLDEKGYKIEGIVFSIAEELDDIEKESRKAKIRSIIDNINEANQKAIEKKLKRIYN